MAVWPLVAIETERGAFDKAADRLAVLVVPWERPMPDDLRRDVKRARCRPGPETSETVIALAKTPPPVSRKQGAP